MNDLEVVGGCSQCGNPVEQYADGSVVYSCDHHEPTLAELHALVRSRLHGNKHTPEAKQSHSRLQRDMWGKMKPEDIRDGIEGVCKLRDAGKIQAWEPDFGLRQALRWHYEGRQLWDAALDHERHQTRDVAPGRARPPKPHPDIPEHNPNDYGPGVRGTGPKPMADLLGRMGL